MTGLLSVKKLHLSSEIFLCLNVPSTAVIGSTMSEQAEVSEAQSII